MNLTIFDWDDTLLSSSYLFSIRWCSSKPAVVVVGGQQDSLKMKKSLETLEELVYNCLALALGQGSVIIVTNSTQGWVERSCQSLLPRVFSLLQHIPVISARHWFSHESTVPYEWKRKAFRECISLAFGEHPSPEVLKRVVSVGDSNDERRALLSLETENPGMVVVAFKFQESPSLEELNRELTCLNSVLGHALLSSSSLDLVYFGNTFSVIWFCWCHILSVVSCQMTSSCSCIIIWIFQFGSYWLGEGCCHIFVYLRVFICNTTIYYTATTSTTAIVHNTDKFWQPHQSSFLVLEWPWLPLQSLTVCLCSRDSWCCLTSSTPDLSSPSLFVSASLSKQ